MSWAFVRRTHGVWSWFGPPPPSLIVLVSILVKQKPQSISTIWACEVCCLSADCSCKVIGAHVCMCPCMAKSDVKVSADYLSAFFWSCFLLESHRSQGLRNPTSNIHRCPPRTGSLTEVTSAFQGVSLPQEVASETWASSPCQECTVDTLTFHNSMPPWEPPAQLRMHCSQDQPASRSIFFEGAGSSNNTPKGGMVSLSLCLFIYFSPEGCVCAKSENHGWRSQRVD